MTAETLVPVAHPGGFTIRVHPAWTTELDPGPGLALVSVEPPREGGGFRANHVVTLDRLPAAMDLRSWQLGTDALLARTLRDYQLIDLEHIELGGVPGVRRLAHYATGRNEAVTMTQWALVEAGSGCTLTSTVATASYPWMLRHLEAVASDFRPGQGAVR